MTLREYKPIRILKKLSLKGIKPERRRKEYPNSIPSPKGELIYKPGTVLDAPTDEERSLFKHLSSVSHTEVAVEIPQLRGFDDPRSGLSRSRRDAHRGKQKWLQSGMAMSAPSESSKTKKPKKKADEPKPEKPKTDVKPTESKELSKDE